MNDKILVFYVFHIFNDRVKYFFDNCIFKDDNIDFIIICNNKDTTFINTHNVKTLYRDNIGYDFGGWSDALLIDNLYKNYNKFIFVNSSVIGPFIPSYYKGKWTDIYINGLEDNIKLFGSTINTCGDPQRLAHVQSYIFSMNRETLEYLIDCEIFSMINYAKTFIDAVNYKEILMSRKIIENKWNIGSLFKYYNGVDFSFTAKNPIDYRIEWLDDIMYPKFRNNLWNDYDLVFIKGNRMNML